MMGAFDMELLRKFTDDYFKSSKKGKNEIISRYSKLVGIKRAAAIKRFSRYRYGAKTRLLPRKKKGSKYDLDCENLVREIWFLGDMICGERLHTVIDVYLEQLESNGILKRFGRDTVEKIRNISLSSLKRIIAEFPKPSSKKHRGNSFIYKSVKIVPDFGKFAEKKPGYVEVDYVEHNGGCSSGVFAITGNYTDVYSQWVSRGAALGKGLDSVKKIDETALSRIYFPVVHYHPDNDKSILSLLLEKLKAGDKASYELSRSRPYKKNDNAHVEQKNGDKIRKLVGYGRYETEVEVELLNKIYEKADLVDNFFIPSAKLKEKIQNDKFKVVKKTYYKPMTPYERIMNSKDVEKNIKDELKLIYASLNLVKLRKELNALLDQLYCEMTRKTEKFSRTFLFEITRVRIV